MESFYKIASLVPVVVMLLILVMVGITLQSQQGNTIFPKLQNACPDGWTTRPDGCTLSLRNDGVEHHKITPSNMGHTSEKIWEGTRDYVWKEGATICDKRKWALINAIQWDGVSNYNQCD
jgi:hypothetical protein